MPCRLSRNRNLNIAAWRCEIDGLCHAFNHALDARPTRCGQYNNCYFAAREILLISEILVGRDQNGKAVLFGFLQQLAIFQIVPTELKGRDDLMGCEVLAERNRSTLVEKNAHLRRFERAGRVLKYRAHLRERDTWKPGNKVRDLGPVFEILEQRGHGNTSAAKNPRATNALRVALNGRAGRPINHAVIVDPAQRRFNCDS